MYRPEVLARECAEKLREPIEKIVWRFNAQAIRYGGGRREFDGMRWTVHTVAELCRRHNIEVRAMTPEEHHQVQLETARKMEKERAKVPIAIAPEEEESGPQRFHFRGAERKYVFGRLRAMFEENVGAAAAAERLRSENILLPNGKPVDGTWVSGKFSHWRKSPPLQWEPIHVPRSRELKLSLPPRAVAPALIAAEPPSNPFALPASVLSVLGDREISDDERLQVMLIFVDLPLSAQPMMGDEKLSVAQKLSVVQAVGTRRKGEA